MSALPPKADMCSAGASSAYTDIQPFKVAIGVSGSSDGKVGPGLTVDFVFMSGLNIA